MNNEINNINEDKDKKTINPPNIVEKYNCIFHCPLLNNNIVSAIDIDNNYLVYGTFMGEVALCLIDEFYFDINKETLDQNITNTNMTIDEDKKEEKKNIKEIKLITDNKFKKGNQNLFKNMIKNKKKNIKDIKVYLNKEPDSEEFQQTEDINSNNLNDKLQLSKIYTDKMVNNYNSSNIVRIKKLYINKIEQISCVSLLNNVLNFSVGDFQLIHCERITSFLGNDLKYSHNFKQIDNYISDKVHNEFCETAQCFMTKTNYLIIYSFYSDFNWPLKFSQVKYENKNLKTFDVIKGSIYMSNFNVPFDFDGDKILYLEYYSKTMRSINIYSTIEDEKIFQFFIKNDFGHISFMKFLPDDCIFLCRNIYICEIYKISKNVNDKSINNKSEVTINEIKDFEFLKSWTHVQDYEIISCNVYLLENKNGKENEKENKNNKNFNHSKIKKENDNKNKYNSKNYAHPLKLLESERSSESYTSSKNQFLNMDKNFGDNNSDHNNVENLIKIDKIKNDGILININNDKTKETTKKYYILTLDSEGNFNSYYYNHENNEEIKKTLFNLYEIQNIEKKYKNLKFFSMGFPYYITMNDYYYVITTDNGIFVIKTEKEEN